MTARERFINSLLKIATPGNIITRYQLGTNLLARQIHKMRARINTRNLPVSGFHPNLVAHNQRGQMYRHLHFHLACTLLGPPGRLLSWFTDLIDKKQASTGRAESSTEVLNNIAGRQIGLIILQLLKKKLTPEQARQQLNETLS
ncbi:MAG: hypothetical protein AAGC74_14655 [Verrucomicrobiota bacterium]